MNYMRTRIAYPKYKIIFLKKKIQNYRYKILDQGNYIAKGVHISVQQEQSSGTENSIHNNCLHVN